MILENSFTVPADVEQTWEVLGDLERIAPCMPGGSLDAVDGDDFTGRVKVKIGAIQMAYKMKGTFVERDVAARRMVIAGSGSENRGAGTVKGAITLALSEDGAGGTTANLVTDLAVTGKPAQFGRGVLADVSAKIVGQFASNLAALMAADTPPADTEPASETPVGAAPRPVSPAPAPAPAQAQEALDLLDVLAPSKIKMVAVGASLALALATILAIVGCRGRNQSRRRAGSDG